MRYEAEEGRMFVRRKNGGYRRIYVETPGSRAIFTTDFEPAAPFLWADPSKDSFQTECLELLT